MAVKTEELAKGYRPFQFHGLDLTVKEDQAVSNCPFCGKEGKFFIEPEEGLWDCKVCVEKGNPITFIRKLIESGLLSTSSQEYSELAQNRGLLSEKTLPLWGVCRSPITNDWLVPAYNRNGKIVQVYRYVKIRGKSVLLATPTLNHGLFGMGLFSDKKPITWICEGPWDGMALWEIMGKSKADGGKLLPTNSIPASLLNDVNVIAVPGAGTFSEAWANNLGEEVVLAYDSDHSRENNGTVILGAGILGAKRASEILSASENPPDRIAYVEWGPNGFDPDQKSGYDVRDFLTGTKYPERVKNLSNLLDKVKPIPGDWVSGRSKKAKASGGTELELLPCSDWKTLITSWRKALKWTDGLDCALSVMLASITSTKSVGDQLWVKIIGPAACGKSTLCEALSVNRKYVFAKSTIRGFHSGFQSDNAGEEDNSLLSQLDGKTLVTKDGDTLLQSPNLGQILSEARDVYDRTSRTHYRNRMSRDYEGVSMTWLLCGTSSLRSIDSSELGERFLDCVVVDRIDEDLEQEIALRVAYRAAREMSVISNGKAGSQDGPEMVKAKQLTGGYVTYLRENAQELLSKVTETDETMLQCVKFGTFVAFVRARPSSRQDETAEREMSYRLTSQMVRLAKCMAVVLNRDSLDAEVMSRVRKVALDTARGDTYEIASVLYAAGEDGSEVAAISIRIHKTDDKTRTLLRFLRRIGFAESFVKESKVGVSSRTRWRLTPRLRDLYKSVVNP